MVVSQAKYGWKIYGMYMNHPHNKHDEWIEEKIGRDKPKKMVGPSLQGLV